MSQFSLENDIRAATRMDSSINTGKGPFGNGARWQKKALESSNTSLNASGLGVGLGGNKFNTSARLDISNGAGIKRLSESLLRKTPSKNARRSPSRLGKSPGRETTPGRKTPKTPGGSDRFIPNRTATDFDASHFKLMRENLSESDREMMSPSKREYQRVIAENLQKPDLNNTRILAYQQKAPAAPEGHANNLKILYSQSKTHSTVKSTRHIPQVPERILDAPDIVNDYYLNLLDWSSNNHLAVALGAHVYLWSAGTGEINHLMELEGPEDYVCSVRWIKEGNYLAVGTSSGEVQLWDVEAYKRTRVMPGHDARVASVAWNQYILSSGGRSGDIVHHDVRIAQHQVARALGHTQEVCGLSWSPDGRVLASGGNDNLLNLWQASGGECYGSPTPSHSLSQHQAAVKALAWCPWQPNILASGGGTADRTIRIWNASNGSLVNTVDTKSQVCSLLWASEYKELISSHGYANNEVVIWRYPQMTRTAELLGHTERVLHTALSPDGSTLVSAGADETLRLWKCFTADPNKKKEQAKAKSSAASSLRMGIR